MRRFSFGIFGKTERLYCRKATLLHEACFLASKSASTSLGKTFAHLRLVRNIFRVSQLPNREVTLLYVHVSLEAQRKCVELCGPQYIER